MVEVTVAKSFSELMGAFEVAHDAFVGEGIISPRQAGVFFHPQSLGYNALMVIAKEDNIVIGTTGAILDSTAGFPLDNVFGSELNRIRRRHPRIAELGMIASRDRLDSHVIDQMICIGWWWAEEMGAKYIVTSCHPHHSRFYIRRYGVKPISVTKKYPKFNDALVDLLGGSMEDGLASKRGGRMLQDYKPEEDFFNGRFTAEVSVGVS